MGRQGSCLARGRPLSNDLDDVTFNGDGRTLDWTMAVTATCRDAREYLAGGRPLSNESYSIVALTGMDAQTERPYRIQSRLVSSHSASVIPPRRRVGTLGCVKSEGVRCRTI